MTTAIKHVGSKLGFRSWFCAASVAVVMSCALVGGFVAAADDKKNKAPELSWRKEAGAKLFEQGKDAFSKQEYRDAYKHFKGARKHAKDKATKQEVRRWTSGAEGGAKLASFREQAEQGKKYVAYQRAEKELPRYQETPVREEYEKFIAEIRGQLFQALETFESKGNRFSEKYGKTFIREPKFVKQGRQALRWIPTGTTPELKVKKVPSDLKGFRAVSFWMCFESGSAPYQIVFKAKGKGKTELTGKSVINGYFKQMKGHKGWKRIEVPLDKMDPQGTADWTKILDFRIQFSSARKITTYVDDIALIKK